MSGATIPSTIERLVVVPSFSGPRVSDSSPQALFRTFRHGPASQTQPFEDLDAVRCWAVAFVPWYSPHRLDNAIQFVTHVDQQVGLDVANAVHHEAVYHAARASKPAHWPGVTRSWSSAKSEYWSTARSSTAVVAGR